MKLGIESRNLDFIPPRRPIKADGTKRFLFDLLVLDLVDKGLVTDQIVLTVGYDIENLSAPVHRKAYKGQITTDRYGRQVPKHAHGTANIGRYTSSTRLVTDAVLELYDRIVDKSLLVRRLNISANHVICEADVPKENKVEQLDLFTDYAALEKEKEKEDAALEREKKMQQAIFNGQIYPAETVVPKCKKFRDAGEAVANIMVYFEQKLSKEDYDKLEKLNDHLADRQCLQTEEHFKFGFAMGVLLMKEIYELPDFHNME